MTTEAWNAMEALATAMTNAKSRKEKERLKKLEEIRKYNEEHPVVPITQVVYEAKQTEAPITNHWYQVAKQLLPKKK